MTDNLVERPVLRIYTEATSGNGGLWAFSPYKSVHTVFVEESNYRDLEDRIEALTARAEAAEAERDALTAENRRLREALEGAESWLDRWATHVGNCAGGEFCTCGLTFVRYETSAALRGEQK